MDTDRDAAVLTYVKDAVLNEGEHIVWRGRPSPSASAKIELARTVFGVSFMAVGAAWSIFALGIVVWLALPGLVGLFFGARLSSHALIYYLKSGRTYYAVTNQRILMISAGKSVTVDSVNGAEIKKLRRVEKQDGTGNVSFRYTTKTGRDQNDRVQTYTSYEFRDGLWGVPDVAGAARAIAALQPAAASDGSNEQSG